MWKLLHYERLKFVYNYFLLKTWSFILKNTSSFQFPWYNFYFSTFEKVFEILAFVFLMVTMGYFRRITLTVSSMLLASIVCLIIGIMLNFDDGNKSIVTAYQWLAFFGKFFISGTSAWVKVNNIFSSPRQKWNFFDENQKTPETIIFISIKCQLFSRKISIVQVLHQ